LLSSLFAHISNWVSGRKIIFRLCMDFKGKHRIPADTSLNPGDSRQIVWKLLS
jgi:hypothetical protein